MAAVETFLRWALGLDVQGHELGVLPMSLRAVVVYVATVLMVRLGKKRFMGRATAFDVILGIMLGSVVSRAVTGNAPFLPALAAGAVLVAMHWLFSSAALASHRVGELIKGAPRTLIRDGAIDHEALRRAHMTEHDLWEDLRGKSVSKLDEVAEARLERSGQVSVVKAKPAPRVVEIAVADGVQTVRIEIPG